MKLYVSSLVIEDEGRALPKNNEQEPSMFWIAVENETGLLGDSRDGSVAAEKRLRTGLTHKRARHDIPAKYINQVAEAREREYPLPLYTNVWNNYVGDDSDNDFPVVVGGGGNPGDYPSGGSTSNVLDIWQRFAPALELIAPDIYLDHYSSSCRIYRHRDQALFIPEQQRDE
ncbi:hypothetical protein N7490_011074 [Penicillium lividum]|nr:hypothetical protein N7490_011074 [Penicillium lividum]